MQIFVDCKLVTNKGYSFADSAANIHNPDTKQSFFCVDVEKSDTFYVVSRKLQAKLNSIRILGDSQSNDSDGALNYGNFVYVFQSHGQTVTVDINEKKFCLSTYSVSSYDILSLQPKSSLYYYLACTVTEPTVQNVVTKMAILIIFLWLLASSFPICFGFLVLLSPFLTLYYIVPKHTIFVVFLGLLLYGYPLFHENVSHPCYALGNATSRWEGFRHFNDLLRSKYDIDEDFLSTSTWRGLFSSSSSMKSAYVQQQERLGSAITDILSKDLSLTHVPPNLQCTMWYYMFSIERITNKSLLLNYEITAKLIVTNLEWEGVMRWIYDLLTHERKETN